jgi:hypothetical protein
VLWRRVRTDAGFLSIQDPRLLFGLGDGEPGILRVRWPSGRRDELPLAAEVAGRYWRLREGDGELTPLRAPPAAER